jgi:hypothetical protein
VGSAWWSSTLQPTLSQGDVLVDVPVGTVTNPPKYLKPAVLRQNLAGWSETLSFAADSQGMGHYVDRGRPCAAMVLSFGCELDKQKKKPRVQVGLLQPLAKLSESEQQTVIASDSYNCLYLPGVPAIGDHYLDLRCTTYLPGDVCTAAGRVASMTDEALIRLHAQLVAFYTRLDLKKIYRAIGQ